MRTANCSAMNLIRVWLMPFVLQPMVTSRWVIRNITCFGDQIAPALGRRAQPGKAGKSRKVAEPGLGALFA